MVKRSYVYFKKDRKLIYTKLFQIAFITTAGGFGNQSSYLMVHIFNFATCRFNYGKHNAFSFSQYIYKLEMRSLYVQWGVLVQLYKYYSIMNPRQLPDTKLSTQFIYTMNHVPFQMYKCCLTMFLRQLVSRQEMRYSSYKCTRRRSARDCSCNWTRRRSVSDWFLKLRSYNFPHQMYKFQFPQPITTSTDNRFLINAYSRTFLP